MFTTSLNRLEIASGSPDVDVRLTADIATKVRQKTKELGLDPNDTTGKELYHGLQALVKKHDEFLCAALGGSDPQDVNDLLPRIIEKVKRLPQTERCWALKPSVAKKLLKETPPKKVMKQLGYRSIESMLKRESIDELFGAIRFLESSNWVEHFIGTFRRLRPGDFETSPIRIVQLSTERWGHAPEQFATQSHGNIAYVRELGAVVVLPLPVDRMRGVCITMLPLLLYAVNEIRIFSAYFKLQQVKPDFAKLVVTTLLNQPEPAFELAGQQLHWRVIQRYYGSQPARKHPQVFEPHVQPEDLQWRQAEALLYRIEPALKFWENLDYVGALDADKAVSFNLLDNAVSYCNDLPFAQRFNHYFRESLWSELFGRYIGQKSLENQLLEQLDEAISYPLVANAFSGGEA